MNYYAWNKHTCFFFRPIYHNLISIPFTICTCKDVWRKILAGKVQNKQRPTWLADNIWKISKPAYS
jgi:hypothetical protein